MISLLVKKMLVAVDFQVSQTTGSIIIITINKKTPNPFAPLLLKIIPNNSDIEPIINGKANDAFCHQ